MTESFPRQQARTRRFTLGAPRNFTVSEDGSRLVFLRAKSGDDPTTCVWTADTGSGEQRLFVDPTEILAAGSTEELPVAEKARRERARESAAGVVSYAVGGSDGNLVSFALAGRPYVVDLETGQITEDTQATGGAFDVRVDPTGTRVAYVSDEALRVWELSDGSDRELISEATPDVTWGSAEFVAGEEMGRTSGYWWSPDGDSLLVSRVDVSPVSVWFLADPTEPAAEPRAMRYPAAGTANAVVGLAIVETDGSRIDVDWAGDRWEYLADVRWSSGAGLHLVVQTRDQRTWGLLTVDPATGSIASVHEITDDIWVELVPGTPAWWDSKLVTVEEAGGSRQLVVDGEPVSGSDLWVRRVIGEFLGGIVFTASSDPTEVHVFRWTPAGVEQLTSEPGVHDASVGGATMVTTSSVLTSPRRRFSVSSGAHTFELDDLSESANLDVSVEMLSTEALGIRAAVLFPATDDGSQLPVLLDPYGGPHAQRVLASYNAFTASQWFADRGFVVIVADGRGTPARGGDWERSIYGDLATLALDDQIAALEHVEQRHPGRLDMSRVAIRGWSFGGYLAALAVMRRPDVFKAAVAGAPVTDWRLYDTHYTERYLGHPDIDPENYERSSLLTMAPSLDRPLMLIHGLADDNVVAAHTLQLSRALLHHGRPHEVLPLAGVSHMTPQEEVAENLLLLQIEFLRRSLG